MAAWVKRSSIDRHTQATYTSLTTALVWFDRDTTSILHKVVAPDRLTLFGITLFLQLCTIVGISERMIRRVENFKRRSLTR